MTRFSRTLLLALLFAIPASVHAFGLPDTGQTKCYTDTGADTVAATSASSVAADMGAFPRQDCRYGRDAAVAAGATKTGGGAYGFDYTKIANNGSLLPATFALGSNPTDWACTQDNITGLMWEVKTTSGLRSYTSTYSWYNSNAATNGVVAGTANGGTCSGGTGCDTEKFVSDVNSASLCTYTDWRMPSQRELLTLVVADGSYPSIDSTYLPNTQGVSFWSGSSYVSNPNNAWYVSFGNGGIGYTFKEYYLYVRLVRGGQF
jgi:hypothetical protein